MRHLIAIFAVVFGSAGCASYMTPGGPALLAQIGGGDVADTAQQPSPQFPLSMVAVRVQAADYRSLSANGYGKGRFSVIAPPELMTPPQLQTVAHWPQVASVAVFDASLLPASFESLADLRFAAAKMQADVLMVFTVATRFRIDGHDRDPASKIALGDKPDADAAVSSTASLAFVDVRTGFTYGATQADASVGGLADAWGSDATLDGKRLEAERQAFAALLVAAGKSWDGIVGRYR
ncbi:hypothetical protein [Solimonas terrae]|uniref:DUF3313 domain-containing protein n=1 Tax=Solimonas terrae TaxID=1396819 RepID=A0A6M2BSD8_9GAMM|nr:hypothetical protein [Solimonas terrae]NGY05023.1 hypothetical protein [Solimonas terrae]